MMAGSAPRKDGQALSLLDHDMITEQVLPLITPYVAGEIEPPRILINNFSEDKEGPKRS